MNEELSAVPGETVRGRLDKVRGSQTPFGKQPSMSFLDAEEQRAYGEHFMCAIGQSILCVSHCCSVVHLASLST